MRLSCRVGLHVCDSVLAVGLLLRFQGGLFVVQIVQCNRRWQLAMWLIVPTTPLLQSCKVGVLLRPS